MNAQPHRIRLPKPWNLVTSYGTDPHDTNMRVTTHEFQRNFQCPSGLTTSSQLTLEIQPQDDGDSWLQLACLLNGQALDVATIESGASRLPITLDRLQPVNRLTVRVTRQGQPPTAILPQVALVIG